MGSVLKDLLSTSEQLEQDTLLDKLVSFNRRCNGRAKDVEDVAIFREITDIFDVLLTQTWLLFFSKKTRDSSCDNLSSECTSGHAHMNIWRRSVNTSYLNSVTRLHLIDQVVL